MSKNDEDFIKSIEIITGKQIRPDPEEDFLKMFKVILKGDEEKVKND